MSQRTIVKANLDDAALQHFGTDIPKTISEFYGLLTILKSFGILAAYRQLEHPEIMPEACLKRASRTLDLQAYHGDKWLFESWLEPQLERLRLRQGKVRFLLSCTIDSKTIARCQQLVKCYSNVFSVRIFAEPAIFRSIIIDDRYLLLGHYGYEVIEKDGHNAKGWKSPQLFIEDNRQWSLLIPFKELFRITWERARDISQLTHVKSTEETRDGKPVIHYFVSYAREDHDLKEKLLALLKQHLAIAKDYYFEAWDDGEILAGEYWHDQIQAAISRCQFGLLLVSPAFFSSAYIKKHELPAFVDRNPTSPATDKRAIPVALKSIPFNNSIDMKGLIQQQIFHDRAGKAFQERSGKPKTRDDFASELFQHILKIVKRYGSVTS